MLQKGQQARATRRKLHTTYHLLRGQFQAVRQRSLLIECARCHTRMRWQQKTDMSPEQARPSICPHCAVTQGARELGTLALLITVLRMESAPGMNPRAARTTSESP
jgi:hypothetical protein